MSDVFLDGIGIGLAVAFPIIMVIYIRSQHPTQKALKDLQWLIFERTSQKATSDHTMKAAPETCLRCGQKVLGG
jgi:hypothetical protein